MNKKYLYFKIQKRKKTSQYYFEYIIMFRLIEYLIDLHGNDLTFLFLTCRNRNIFSRKSLRIVEKSVSNMMY